MWQTYSDEFKHWYTHASRAEKTQMINDGVSRDGHKLTNDVMAKWNLQEATRTRKQKESGWKSNAVIFEVASQMVGGEANLRQAVQRGAVIMQKEGGLELFSFPSSQSKMSETMSRDVHAKADTALTDAQYEEIKACNHLNY